MLPRANRFTVQVMATQAFTDTDNRQKTREIAIASTVVGIQADPDAGRITYQVEGAQLTASHIGRAQPSAVYQQGRRLKVGSTFYLIVSIANYPQHVEMKLVEQAR